MRELEEPGGLEEGILLGGISEARGRKLEESGSYRAIGQDGRWRNHWGWRRGVGAIRRVHMGVSRGFVKLGS